MIRLGKVRRALIVAPHPDDETIGCAGLMLRLKRNGASVSVVVVTDGAASHRNSARFPRERLIRERAREVRRACALLGVPAGRVHMLALPDGGLDTLNRAGRARLVRGLARHARVNLLAMPAPDDAHPDHRNTARACIRRQGWHRRIGYGVWPARRPTGPTVTLPLRSDRALKSVALGRHATQMGRIADDSTGFTIDRSTRARFLRPAERYREL